MTLTEQNIREIGNELTAEFIVQGCEESPFDPTDWDGLAELIYHSKAGIEMMAGCDVDDEDLAGILNWMYEGVLS